MPSIKAVKIAAAHEGVAELVITMEYQNGGVTDYALDAMASQYLFDVSQAQTADDLIGLDWQLVQQAISHSYNRFFI